MQASSSRKQASSDGRTQTARPGAQRHPPQALLHPHRRDLHIDDPTFRLQAKLLYGAGLRRLECLRLRVKDVDFGQHPILVRDTKGNEDRVTLLPEQLVPILREHLRHVKDVKTTMIYTHVLQTGPPRHPQPPGLARSQSTIPNPQSAIHQCWPIAPWTAPATLRSTPPLADRPPVRCQAAA